MGSSTFIDWVKDIFLPIESREIPAVKQLRKYKTKQEIIGAISKGAGKSFYEIINEGGIIRQIAMDLLFRIGGLKETEIGEMMGVNYSTVSQGRTRLREKLKKDKKLTKIMKKIESALSI